MTKTIYPTTITYSGLLEDGYSSSGAVTTDCTIALGFKPTGPPTTPLTSQDGHYLLTIQKQGSTVKVWKQDARLDDYTGSIGNTYAEFLSNVLTAYSGSDRGYYSRLAVVEQLLSYSDFWECSDLVTGVWMPKSLDAVTPQTLLDFADAAGLGADASWKLCCSSNFAPDPLFAHDGSNGGWIPNTGISISGGVATCSRDSAGSIVRIEPGDGSLENNKYLIKFVIDSISSGGIQAYTFNWSNDGIAANNQGPVETSAGTHYAVVEADSDATQIGIRAALATDAVISEVSFYEILDASFTGPNDWTINGSPVQTLDTPTSNYCTLNSLDSNTAAPCQLSNGNLTATRTTSAKYEAYGTTFTDCRFYYEATPTLIAGTHYVGIMGEGGINPRGHDYLYAYMSNGKAYVGASGGTSVIWAPYTAGDTVGVACDGTDVTFYKNGVLQGSLTMDQPAHKWTSLIIDGDINGSTNVNFGATGFTHTPPAGFKALCSKYHAQPQVLKSSSVADIVLRTGTNGIVSHTEGTNHISSNLNLYGNMNNCFDGNTSQSYTATAGATGTFETYAGKIWSSKRTMTKVTFWAANDYQLTGGTWNCYFEGQKDDDSWEVIASTLNNPILAAGQSFSLEAPTNVIAYKGHRIRFTRSVGADWQGPAEVQFQEAIAPIVLPDMEGGPDWVNIKSRTTTRDWAMFDTARGINRVLRTNSSDQEFVASTYLTSFNSDGYSLGSSSIVNESGASFIDLCLKAGPAQGFEIATATSDANGNYTLPHSLGAAPTFLVEKTVGVTGSWVVYHKALGRSKYLVLNNTNASTNYTWLSEVGSTRVVRQGAPANTDFVVYLFTDSDIFRAFSYTGNGSADGPFVHLGGKPLSVPFLKNTTSVYNWVNHDCVRNPCNPVEHYLVPNLSLTETTIGAGLTCTSTGFKVAQSSGAWNKAGDLLVGLAILESTNKYANAF